MKIRLSSLAFSGLLVAASCALAQPSSDAQKPAQPSDTQTPAQPLATQSPLAVPNNPNLAIASVRLEGGFRISTIIGSAVRNDQNDKIGTVDDLIVKQDDHIVTAIISVGGFLGIGNKLVAVPYNVLHVDPHNADAKVVLAGADKEALKAMPTFTYGG